MYYKRIAYNGKNAKRNKSVEIEAEMIGEFDNIVTSLASNEDFDNDNIHKEVVIMAVKILTAKYERDHGILLNDLDNIVKEYNYLFEEMADEIDNNEKRDSEYRVIKYLNDIDNNSYDFNSIRETLGNAFEAYHGLEMDGDDEMYYYNFQPTNRMEDERMWIDNEFFIPGGNELRAQMSNARN